MSEPKIPLRVFIGHSKHCCSRRTTNSRKGWPWAFGILHKRGYGRTYESVVIWQHPKTGKRLRSPCVAFICNDTTCEAVAGFGLRDVEDALWK